MRRYSYWPYKERLSELLKMERGESTDAEGARMSRHVFSAQWMQTPKALGGNLIHGVWFPRYTILPPVKYRMMYGDTAQKTKERNDFSCFEVWALCEDNYIYLIDLIKGKWEAPQLKRECIAFWVKHATLAKASKEEVEVALPWLTVAGDNCMGQLRKLKVEDKVSGTGLIQEIRADNFFPVEGIEREKDKLTRVMDVIPYWEQGMAKLPERAPFTSGFVSEGEAFTSDDTHAFDDQIDAAVDAAVDLLSIRNKAKLWERQM